MEIDNSSHKLTDSSVCYSNTSNLNKKNKYEPSQDKVNSGINLRRASDIKSVFNKIDIASISVRKFNLDICEDTNIQIPPHCQQRAEDKQELKRVCLPIFTQDILDSLNQLEIKSSSASKSLQSLMSNKKNKFSIDDCPDAEILENENNWAD